MELAGQVFCFDFAGSGRSEGEYVSLGYHERDDLATVVDYLRGKGTVSSIGVWGRSQRGAFCLVGTSPVLGIWILPHVWVSL